MNVIDTTDPVLVGVPADATLECDAIPTAPTVVTATDNCTNSLTVSYTETIGTGCPYVITRSWDVTDRSGERTTGKQRINLIDTTDHD